MSNKKLTTYFEDEYKKLFRTLYTGFLIGLKNKDEELHSQGLLHSGKRTVSYVIMARELIYNFIDDFEKLLINTQSTFNRKFNNRTIDNYICVVNKALISHSKNFKNEIIKKINPHNEENLVNERLSSDFNVIEQNIAGRLNDIGKKIKLVNQGKKKEFKFLKEHFVYFILTIIAGLIVSIVFAIFF